jgi:phospholipid transport system substrate-binding protein
MFVLLYVLGVCTGFAISVKGILEEEGKAAMHLHWWLVGVFIVALLIYPGGGRAGAEAEGPTQLVQRLVKTINSIKSATNGNLSAADQANNTAAAQAANAMLDVRGVSQWSLGQHWNTLTPAQQQEFVTLLEQLFAKIAYPKSAEFFGDLAVAVKSERITGQRAVVKTTVRHPKEGLVTIDYQLNQQESKWLVRDILLDDVSLAGNLRSQFLKIIAENSYAELLRRMREKLAE